MDSRRAARREWLVKVGVVLAAILASAFVIVTAKILLVLFAGVLGAIVLHAISAGLARLTKLPYHAALGTVVLLGMGLTGAAVLWTIPQVVAPLKALGHHLPSAFQQQITELQHAASRGGPPMDPHATAGASSAAKALITGISGSFELLGGLVMIFFVSLYGAAQPKVYVRAALAALPRERWKPALKALRSAHGNLARWLLGRFLAMLFVGVACTIAFSLLGLPFALVMGILAGLLTFVEYAGAVMSAIPPLAVAFAKSPTTALWVLLIFTALHVIEGYLLTPLLARATVHLPPAFTLAAQVLLGFLAGPLGLTFSTPLLVVAVAGARGWKSGSPRAEARARREHPERARRDGPSYAKPLQRAH